MIDYSTASNHLFNIQCSYQGRQKPILAGNAPPNFHPGCIRSKSFQLCSVDVDSSILLHLHMQEDSNMPSSSTKTYLSYYHSFMCTSVSNRDHKFVEKHILAVHTATCFPVTVTSLSCQLCKHMSMKIHFKNVNLLFIISASKFAAPQLEAHYLSGRETHNLQVDPLLFHYCVVS